MKKFTITSNLLNKNCDLGISKIIDDNNNVILDKYTQLYKNKKLTIEIKDNVKFIDVYIKIERYPMRMIIYREPRIEKVDVNKKYNKTPKTNKLSKMKIGRKEFAEEYNNNIWSVPVNLEVDLNLP